MLGIVDVEECDRWPTAHQQRRACVSGLRSSGVEARNQTTPSTSQAGPNPATFTKTRGMLGANAFCTCTQIGILAHLTRSTDETERSSVTASHVFQQSKSAGVKRGTLSTLRNPHCYHESFRTFRGPWDSMLSLTTPAALPSVNWGEDGLGLGHLSVRLTAQRITAQLASQKRAVFGFIMGHKCHRSARQCMERYSPRLYSPQLGPHRDVNAQRFTVDIRAAVTPACALGPRANWRSRIWLAPSGRRVFTPSLITR